MKLNRKKEHVKNVSMVNKNCYRGLMKSISGGVREFSAVQKQAEKLGIFLAERDLLRCKRCGLMEDVLYDGRLVTYYEGKQTDDIGLRFRRKSDRIYYCPKCGCKVKKARIVK